MPVGIFQLLLCFLNKPKGGLDNVKRKSMQNKGERGYCFADFRFVSMGTGVHWGLIVIWGLIGWLLVANAKPNRCICLWGL